MSLGEDRLTNLCRSVGTEKDTEKLAHLIQELSQELEHRRTKKQPETEKPDSRLRQIRRS